MKWYQITFVLALFYAITGVLGLIQGQPFTHDPFFKAFLLAWISEAEWKASRWRRDYTDLFNQLGYK